MANELNAARVLSETAMSVPLDFVAALRSRPESIRLTDTVKVELPRRAYMLLLDRLPVVSAFPERDQAKAIWAAIVNALAVEK